MMTFIFLTLESPAYGLGLLHVEDGEVELLKRHRGVLQRAAAIRISGDRSWMAQRFC